MTALPYPLFSCRDVVRCWDQGPVLAELAPPAPPAPLELAELEAPPVPLAAELLAAEPLAAELLAAELLAEALELVPAGAASPRGIPASRQNGPYLVSVHTSGDLQSPWPLGQAGVPKQ
jgi:hypothetical protein